ncbi:hypothetical protein SAMN02927937_01176 [Paenimyroides aquimaris]|uniref:Uncharacterized protein n=1 Tax=Paenimyroides marinum TaxID=1159016 RepID=A0A1H6KRQ3_9FLAO|nr:hypothetical protein [Paenimyroides aquimaris]SEH74214.1 hypothetical protein SAMN02927937_01176 [Paenimyroides aquimaris]
MNKITYTLFVFLVAFNCFGQEDSINSFENKFIKHFTKHYTNDSTFIIDKNLLFKTNFESDNFNLSISEEKVNFKTEERILKNPYYSEEYDESDDDYDYMKNYPKSYSVIFENNLVSLFENGKFACYDIITFERNIQLENKLNLKKFKYHWVIDKNLIAQSGNSKFVWSNSKWIELKERTPLKKQPKLYDDNEFIVYSDCFGEWGGSIYFYERATSKIFFTESTCANTVIKSDKGYEILAHLGHMSGSSEIKIVPDPRKLTLLKRSNKKTNKNREALGYSDKSNAFIKVFDLYDIQIFSLFYHNNQKLYVVNVADLTFLAKINKDRIKIVHPLFFDDLYTHNPVTTQYEDVTLINLDFYGTALEREVSLLLISKDRIVKIDWNELQRN